MLTELEDRAHRGPLLAVGAGETELKSGHEILPALVGVARNCVSHGSGIVVAGLNNHEQAIVALPDLHVQYASPTDVVDDLGPDAARPVHALIFLDQRVIIHKIERETMAPRHGSHGKQCGEKSARTAYTPGSTPPGRSEE